MRFSLIHDELRFRHSLLTFYSFASVWYFPAPLRRLSSFRFSLPRLVLQSRMIIGRSNLRGHRVCKLVSLYGKIYQMQNLHPTLIYRLNWIKRDFPKKLLLILVPCILSLFINLELQLFRNWSWHYALLAIPFAIFAYVLGHLGHLTIYAKYTQPVRTPHFPTMLIISVYLFVINAFAEEFFSRLFLQHILTTFMPPALAIVFTSLIFAWSHVILYRWKKGPLFISFLAGLYFGTLYYYTNSFLLVWLVHGATDLGFISDSLAHYLYWSRKT